AVSAALRPPDLLIYLRADLATLRRHIRQRGRGYEEGIEDAYLLGLDALYEAWVASYDLSPVVVVPAAELDFVHRDDDRDRLLELVERAGLVAPLVG
ncbi:MAG: deoxynucleoside kinase, partial [Deinococcales bacterium]